MTDNLHHRIETICQSPVRSLTALSGGDFAIAYRVDLENGQTVFAKTHADPPPGFFTTEATGLRWLAEPKVINVAQVVGVSDDHPACLILEWIEPGGATSETSEAVFGRQLASLHRSGTDGFGRLDGRTTGSQALPNNICASWPEFYRDCRLRPLAEISARTNTLAPSTIDRLLALADRLGDIGAADEPPARLHGDLWAGNRLVDEQGNSWLVDPAGHGGHREFDLAMMRLFGGFGNQCFSAYHDAFPLADGWQDRIRLHQLAPLVVHAIKFGAGYVAGVDDALSRYD